MKKKLTGEHQQFIIIQLARFCTPSEVVEMLQSEFGVKATRQQVSYYNPTTGQSGDTLKPEWIDLFNETRADFVKDASRIGIAHRTYRLMQLDRLYHRAFQQKNYLLAMKALEQAAKECGGFYERAKPASITGSKAQSVINLEDWKRLHGIMTNVG